MQNEVQHIFFPSALKLPVLGAVDFSHVKTYLYILCHFSKRLTNWTKNAAFLNVTKYFQINHMILVIEWSAFINPMYLWLCANLRRKYNYETFSWVFKDSSSLKHSVLLSCLKLGFRKDSQHKFKGYFVLCGYRLEKWVKRRQQSL